LRFVATRGLVRAALIQINGWPTPLRTHYTLGSWDTDTMAHRTVVIVVDDDPGLLKSVARLSAHHGIDSRTFSSAEALLESDSVQTARRREEKRAADFGGEVSPAMRRGR
jgi:hypothetical protein